MMTTPRRALVATPINVTNETAAQMATKLVPAAWGSVGIQSGAVAVINAATFQYGGGAVNTQDFTIPSQSVLAFITDYTDFILPITAFDDLGTHVYVTNNNFYNNFGAAMQIEPNGLMAGNPLTPLASGDPFLRGNVMTGNGVDGLMVLTNLVYKYSANYSSYLGPVEAIAGSDAYSNLSVDSVWDLTDITYVLEGTLIIDGAYDNGFFNGEQLLNAPVPSTTAYGAIPTPVVSLTIQSALPGTMLADGETIPSPGQSVIVKLYSDNTPYDSGNLGTYGSSGSIAAVENAGAGFVVGVDDGVDPTGGELIDPGAYSELRILGIPGNQTTGQQRVPVIITSLRDDTVGFTVRGVVMDDIWNSDPVLQYYAAQAGTTFNLTTPEPGDGGYIYVGALSLNEYDPTDPLEGSIIDNADISYMTSIQIQGGGIIDNSATANPNYPADERDILAGNAGPATQFNAAFNFTIDDSNLADFSSAAVFAHPDSLNQADRTITATGATTFTGTLTSGSASVTGISSTASLSVGEAVAGIGIPAGTTIDAIVNLTSITLSNDAIFTGSETITATGASPPTRGSLVGEPVDLYLYNDTISNSVQGVHINSFPGDDSTGSTPFEAVLLNDTFYNDTYDIQTVAPQLDSAPNDFSVVNLLAMNDIFDGAADVAVNMQGQAGFERASVQPLLQQYRQSANHHQRRRFRGQRRCCLRQSRFRGPCRHR